MSNQLIDQMAHADLVEAVWQGRRRRFARWLMRKNNRLVSFVEIAATLHCKGRHYVGLRTVSVNNIVGSVGRCQEFDRSFAPRQSIERNRWIRIATAYYEDIALPPVELYQVGEMYFVVDGNHRISVASARGQQFIEAYITEIDAA